MSEIDDEVIYEDGFEPSITKPFDPSKIKLDISTVNLLSLINELENEEINLSPDFQRATDVWDSTKKSRLIESILLGLPLPSFYFNEDEGGNTRSVIDGVQRLCAIRDFVLGKDVDGKRVFLKLKNLQFLKQYEGMTFGDLSRPDIRRIHSLKITTNTLGYQTPSEVKLVIFQRVNSAGEPLTDQEMRHALNQGLPANFIKKLSESEAFIRATSRKINSRRMLDRDFVNRFIAFFCGYEHYDGNLDIFLNDQMGALKGYSDRKLNFIAVAFEKAMDTCYEIFGDWSFRKINKNGKYSKISKSLFDSLSVNIAWLTDDQRSELICKKDKVQQALQKLFQNEEFGYRLSSGTGKLSNVKYRFGQIDAMLKNVLNSDNVSVIFSEE
ncbi:MAG: DUF262 domain-containing protein [Clostridium sp.]|nr:DUF262 domain-containing protein [Clostridium sp.]